MQTTEQELIDLINWCTVSGVHASQGLDMAAKIFIDALFEYRRVNKLREPTKAE